MSLSLCHWNLPFIPSCLHVRCLCFRDFAFASVFQFSLLTFTLWSPASGDFAFSSVLYFILLTCTLLLIPWHCLYFFSESIRGYVSFQSIHKQALQWWIVSISHSWKLRFSYCTRLPSILTCPHPEFRLLFVVSCGILRVRVHFVCFSLRIWIFHSLLLIISPTTYWFAGYHS